MRYCASVNGIASAGLRPMDIACNFWDCYNYPSDYADSALARKEYKFDVYIKRAMEYIYPDLNDEFVQDNLNFQSVDDFLENVKTELIIEKKSKLWTIMKLKHFNGLLQIALFTFEKRMF